MKLEQFDSQAAQGDIYLRRINALPADARPVAPGNGRYTLSHSETGHAHVIQATPDVHLYQAANDPLLLYIVVKEPVALTHLRSFDTHRPIQIPPGTFEVRRQREWTPEGWRRAAD